jgi:hypothetical protein
LILTTAKIEDFERFWNTFSTRGAEKRKQHGSEGSHVFRDPNDEDRIWAVLDMEQEAWNDLMSDPEMPQIFQAAGLQDRPQTAEFVRGHDA